MRKEIYIIMMALLFSLGVLLATLQPQTVIGQYAVGGEIVAEAPSPEAFLTSQTVMAIMAIAAAAAAGILVYNKRKV